AITDILALQCRRLPGTCQCPELLPAFQYTRGFQLKARLLSQIPVELQNLFGLHFLITLTDHRQGSMSIGTIQHSLFFIRHDDALPTFILCHVTDMRGFDAPIHTCLLGPEFSRLMLSEMIT